MISILLFLVSLLVMPFGAEVSGQAAKARVTSPEPVEVVLEPEFKIAEPVEPEPAEKPEGPTLYEANTTVLESKEHGPMLCLGGIMESYPPQCGNVPIDGWDWDAVEGEERASGTTWGAYNVRGTYENERFELVKVRRFRNEPAKDGYDFSPACSRPWPTPDQTKTSYEDFDAAVSYANKQRNVAAVWVSYLDRKDPPEERDQELLNAAFTGRLAHHEAELRERWGGPLCVVRYETSRRELRVIRREVESMPEVRDQMLWSDTNEVGSYAEIHVVLLEDQLKEDLERRYGDLVKATGALQPVPR